MVSVKGGALGLGMGMAHAALPPSAPKRRVSVPVPPQSFVRSPPVSILPPVSNLLNMTNILPATSDWPKKLWAGRIFACAAPRSGRSSACPTQVRPDEDDVEEVD
jgi:hypothetical protein